MQSRCMTCLRMLAVAAASFLFGLGAAAAPPLPGQEHEIVRRYETSREGSDGSSGSSSGQTSIVERVIAVRDDGVELEYNLPGETTPEERRRQWMLPVRVFKPATGAMELLNRAELETRRDAWLAAAKWTSDVCGRWIFTWNAFRIECDPDAALETIAAYDITSAEIGEGVPYRVAEATVAATLIRTASGPDGETFRALFQVDPEAVRRERAEADIAVGELMRKPVTLEAALAKRANESVSGTITVTIEVDAAGDVRQRTKVAKIETIEPDGTVEAATSTEVIERRTVGQAGAAI